MKNLKKFISIIMVIVLICISSLPAFAATDEEWELYHKMYDLLELCEETHFAFGIGYSITELVEPGNPNRPKYLACSDTTELEKAWEDACPMVQAFFNSHMFTYDGEISIETATAKYDALHEELYKIIINRSELELLVTFCQQESNEDNYYDAELWVNFQREITQAKELLADEAITDTRVNTAYYELMYQLNLLCTSNQVPGDLDYDGEMSVMDATYIQLFLAKYKDMNWSQLLVIGCQDIDDVDVLAATTIQKKCAKLINMYEPYRLEMMINNLEKSDPESEEFELSSWRNNFIFYYNYYYKTQ